MSLPVAFPVALPVHRRGSRAVVAAGPPDGLPGAEPDASVTIVVAIATSVVDRVRIATSLGDLAPVLMVSTAQEAVALLGGAEAVASPPATPTPLRARDEAAAGLAVDSDGRVLTCGADSVPLSPLEHDLLTCLLDDVGHTRPYDALHRTVWGNDHQGGRCDVQSVVKRLRRKLRLVGSPLGIDVVRGVGLRMVPARKPTTNCLPLDPACPPASIAGRRARS